MSKKMVDWDSSSKDLLDEIDIDMHSKEIPFENVVNSLLDENAPFPARYLYRLSDLEDEDLQVVKQNWRSIPLWRRRALMEDLQMMVEKDMMLSFESVGRLAMSDDDPKVRYGAIETLIANECESTDLIGTYLKLMENDPDQRVRAIATSALGQFVYLDEMDTRQPEMKRELEDRLLAVAQNSNNPDVKRCALEAIGYSTREEVTPLIEAAYNINDSQQQASALIAMGRSGNDRWKPQVMAMLTHPNPNVRTEAARAAGELSISEARSNLFDLVDDANQDVYMAALWSLSQIGGKGVRKVIQERIAVAEENDEIEFLESALDNLDFNEGIHEMNLIGLDEEDIFTSDDSDEFDADDFFSYDEEDEEEDFFDEDADEDGIDGYLEEEDDEDYLDDDDDEDLWR
jgi:hypothetical protein